MVFNFQVWDLKTLQCLQILNGHKNFVTSVLCWDKFLLSGSLDNRLKVCFVAFPLNSHFLDLMIKFYFCYVHSLIVGILCAFCRSGQQMRLETWK